MRRLALSEFTATAFLTDARTGGAASCEYTEWWWNDLGTTPQCGNQGLGETWKEFHLTTYCRASGEMKGDQLSNNGEPLCTTPSGTPVLYGARSSSCDEPITYCTQCGEPEDQCDHEANPPDPRCNTACANRDYDESPVRYIGGTVQSRVQNLFSVAGNGALDLEARGAAIPCATARFVAHEALHTALASMGKAQLHAGFGDADGQAFSFLHAFVSTGIDTATNAELVTSSRWRSTGSDDVDENYIQAKLKDCIVCGDEPERVGSLAR